jgi:hypothetical protein
MAKKVIRLNEKDIESLVRKIIKEESINELGPDSFTDTVDIDNKSDSTVLRPAIAKLKGQNHIVIIDNKDSIIGYGPSVKGLSRQRVCAIAQQLIRDWEDEVTSIDELEGRSFDDIKPITFCSK